jgi:hypothetical protein
MAALVQSSNHIAMASAHMQVQQQMAHAIASVTKHGAANIKDAAKKHKRSMVDDEYYDELELRSPSKPADKHGSAMAALAHSSTQAALAGAHMNMQMSMANAHANVLKQAAANIKSAAKKHKRDFEEEEFGLDGRDIEDVEDDFEWEE